MRRPGPVTATVTPIVRGYHGVLNTTTLDTPCPNAHLARGWSQTTSGTLLQIHQVCLSISLAAVVSPEMLLCIFAFFMTFIIWQIIVAWYRCRHTPRGSNAHCCKVCGSNLNYTATVNPDLKMLYVFNYFGRTAF